MYVLVYVSSAVNLFSDGDLAKLLEVSRHNNHQVGITGLLLYSSGNFMQLLEGPEKAVIQTHTRITGDPRHTGLITLMQGPSENREFEEWSMGFKRLDGANHPAPPGFSNFLDRSWSGSDMEAVASQAFTLLSFFKKNMR